MNWFGIQTIEVIKKEEGLAAAREAAGDYNQSKIDRELLENDTWNNPFEDERKRLEAERKRAADLEKKAAKTREEASNANKGPSVGYQIAAFFGEVMAAVRRINEDERQNTELAEGEVVFDPPHEPKLGGRAITDTTGAVDANAYPADETPLQKLQRLHPADRSKTSAGTDKRRF